MVTEPTSEQLLNRLLTNPNDLTNVENLAKLYMNQGNYADATQMYQRALAIREEILGPEHPELADILNYLTCLYRDQGNHTQAMITFQRVHAMNFAKKLTSEQLLNRLLANPKDLTSLDNLARLYRTQGNYAEAEPLYLRSLAIREEIFGPEHHDLSNTLGDLAVIYKAQGNHTQAEITYRRALAIWKQTLGPDYPNLDTTLDNAADMFLNPQDFKKRVFLGLVNDALDYEDRPPALRDCLRIKKIDYS